MSGIGFQYLTQVSLPVRDLDASIRFYQGVLGLDLIASFRQGVELAFFALGKTRLMLEVDSNPTPNRNPLYFYVENLDEAIAQINEHVSDKDLKPQAIHHDADGTFGDAGETEYMVFFDDPDGNSLALVRRMVD